MKFLPSAVVVLFACRLAVAHAEPDLLNGIAVIVNDAVITYRDIYNTGLAEDEAFLERRYANQPEVLERERRKLMRDRIESLVEYHLILHEFKTSGYVLPESWIEKQIEKEIKRSFGDRATLTKTLQGQGLTYETWAKRIREREIINAMRGAHVPRDPIISPYKIEKYYLEHQDDFRVEDQVKLRMIVVTNQPPGSPISAKGVAEEIMAKLKDGASFDEMARIYSQGSQSSEGGDWGWVERSVLRKDLAEKAFSLKGGELSGVIEAPDGCYIMLVEEVRPAHVRPLAEVRQEIETTLKDEEVRRLRKQWIDKLKSKSFVRYY